MARQTLTIATWVSGALLSLMLVLAFASIWINPWDHRLSLSDGFHVGVLGRGFDVRLAFFNDADYGPYRGSITRLDEHPVRVLHFGDTAGVYYRYFRWADYTLWTLMVSVWYPTAFFAILPAWRLRQRRRWRQSGKEPSDH